MRTVRFPSESDGNRARDAEIEGRNLENYGGRLRLWQHKPGGGDVGPGITVRACRAYRGRGGERESGMDLRGG